MLSEVGARCTALGRRDRVDTLSHVVNLSETGQKSWRRQVKVVEFWEWACLWWPLLGGAFGLTDSFWHLGVARAETLAETAPHNNNQINH